MRFVMMILLSTCSWLWCLTSFANLPYTPITFPRDHGGHFANIPYAYKHILEWWYFNGKATDDADHHLSFDVAFFHPAVKQATVITLPYLHLQVADLDAKKAYGVQNRFPYLSANVSTNSLDITLFNNLLLKTVEENGKSTYILKADLDKDGTHLMLDLQLEPISDPFLINENGLLQEPEETNTYYYTIPRFKTRGLIKVNQHTYTISQQPGETWMDHQWGDFLVNHFGWEWFSVRLTNGFLANILLSYDFSKKTIVDGLANIILPNGEKRFLHYQDFKVTRESFWFDEKLGASFPMVFRFTFPSLEVSFDHVALFPQQEFHGYWEGYCEVNGLYKNEQVTGFSYAELVYANPVA